MKQIEYEKRINELKKKKNAIILAHNYQRPEIQEIADITGDSLELAKTVQKIKQDIIVFCGVSFMAETAKILNPSKKVLLPVKEADCPMAEMVDLKELRKTKKGAIVCYVNTTAETKALSDACCTSSNANQIIKSLPNKKILLVPDKNLAYFLQKQNPDKTIKSWKGYCPYHDQITKKQVINKKKQHPDAVVICHPECKPEVQDASDHVLSTGGMIKFCQKTTYNKFIIITETGLLHRLKKDSPNKKFIPITEKFVCKEMKMTRLKDVLNALEKEQHEIKVPEQTARKARKALKKMIGGKQNGNKSRRP
ncbi:MAG: quinolinate synthase NadA [Nanoarchaeota archaeon]|nr:quinolinate synthase NadA [Nanoarchaeota archaeon]